MLCSIKQIIATTGTGRQNYLLTHWFQKVGVVFLLYCSKLDGEPEINQTVYFTFTFNNMPSKLGVVFEVWIQ